MFNYRNSPLIAGLRGWGLEPPLAVQDELLAQLIKVIDEYYAHLPLKRSALALDPIDRLRLLQSQRRPSGRPGFLRQVLEIVNDLRDRHTTLTLPPPWQQLVAYVPFVVERCNVEGRRVYVVSKHLYGFDEIPLGAVLSHWNGAPIEREVKRLARESQGANPAAALSLGLANLTIRPLAFVLMPQEDWVTVTYVNSSGGLEATTTPWRFFDNGAPAAQRGTATGEAAELLATTLGLDQQTYTINEIKRKSITRRRPPAAPPATRPPLLLKEHALGMRYGKVSTAAGEVGYLRIFSFAVPDAEQFVEACRDILVELPQERLIIDIQGNPGGLIPAGQQLIRLLTAAPELTSSPVAFRSTRATRRLGDAPLFAPWRRSLDLQISTGEAFSQVLPLTTFEDVPAYRYPGKIALIIDALAYSTSDFFAADFKDNNVGVIIGTDPQTGGGGANVWPWDVLCSYVQSTGGQLQALPGGFGLNVSMRRSVRTGAAAGLPVEGLGVEADVLYHTSLGDLFDGNTGLLEFASAQLGSGAPAGASPAAPAANGTPTASTGVGFDVRLAILSLAQQAMNDAALAQRLAHLDENLLEEFGLGQLTLELFEQVFASVTAQLAREYQALQASAESAASALRAPYCWEPPAFFPSWYGGWGYGAYGSTPAG